MSSFLFNNVIVQISDPGAAMSEAGLPLTVDQAKDMHTQQLTATLQEAIFADPYLAKKSEKHARALGALVMLRTGSNAVLVVPREGAAGPQDIFVRFREIDDVVMAHLTRLQSQAMLTFTAVQVAIWSKAA